MAQRAGSRVAHRVRGWQRDGLKGWRSIRNRPWEQPIGWQTVGQDKPDSFSRDVQVRGHGLDAEGLTAQFRGITAQPDGDALMRIDKVQSLDTEAVAVLPANLAIVDLDENRGILEIQFRHELTCMRVDRGHLGSDVARRAEARIGIGSWRLGRRP